MSSLSRRDFLRVLGGTAAGLALAACGTGRNDRAEMAAVLVIVGGGFGGCTINLVAPDKVDDFVDSVAAAYEQRFGCRPETYHTSIVVGVCEI